MHYDLVNPNNASPIILTAEHASNEWPTDLAAPNFPSGWKNKHIAYDIGIAALANKLSESLNCSALLGKYTRLLVDLNRTETSEDIIISESDGFQLETNHLLTSNGKQKRKDNYYYPYHKKLSGLLDQKGSKAIMVSLHSFTPELYTQPVSRPWHAGLLYHKENNLIKHLFKELGANKNLCIGNNQPYSLQDGSQGSVSIHALPRNIDYVEIEIRNDEFTNLLAGIEKWQTLLADALNSYLQNRMHSN